MKHSRGNRGGKSRQWGMREYPPPVPIGRPVSKVCHLDLEVCWNTNAELDERLSYLLICRECHARYVPSHIGHLTHCLGCDRPIERQAH